MNKETHSYEEWKAELIRITACETKNHEHEIVINDDSAMEWYNDGWCPYYTFRETWGMENDTE